MASATAVIDNDWQALDAVLRPGDPQPQGWYAVLTAEELPAEGPVGADFMGGRVVVYRKSSGEPVVMTARPHMGADLTLGDVVDDSIRCTYHTLLRSRRISPRSRPRTGPAAARSQHPRPGSA